MSTFEIIGAVIGVSIVAITVWQIVKNGIANSNGNVDGVSSHDSSRGADGSD